jgi:hypothetical protein
MPKPGGNNRVPRRLWLLLWTLALAATALWLIGLFASHTVLFPPGPSYADITVYKGRFTLFHTARFFTSRAYSGFAYPAGAAVVYAALYATPDPLFTYFAAATAILLAAAVLSWRLLARFSASFLLLPLTAIASFPTVFLLQRANIELLLWLLVAAALLLYWRGVAVAAAVLIGIAGAIKLYPLLLLGLFLRRKRDLPAFAIGLLTAALGTAAAIAFAGPTFSIAASGFFTGVDKFQTHYVDAVSRVEIAFDHCLFSPFKYFAFLQHNSPAPWRTTYYVVAGLIAAALYLRVRTLPFLNRAVFLSVAMVALPPVSFSYTLAHLELPLLLLIAALCAAQRLPATALLAAALLGVVMLPLPALSVLGIKPTGPLASAILLSLMLCAALQAWPSGARPDAP